MLLLLRGMIRLTRCTQADKAGTYFRLHLAAGDHQTQRVAEFMTLRASWTGTALGDVSLVPGSRPLAEHLVRLARGLHPTVRSRLAPAVNRKRAYYDLTIAPPKTVSLAALLDPLHITATQVMRAHTLAVEAVCRMASTMLAPQSRTAPPVDKWMAAVFHHTHTREGDPHLHSHVIFPNIMRNVRGEWRAMQVHIAGENRTRLELAYGNELSHQLRIIGLGTSLVMRSNGLPELGPLRQMALRFNTATKAIAAAAKANKIKQPSQGTAAEQGIELHSRSGLPVSPNRIGMRQLRRLADQIRRPKPKDADDPVRLTEEARRWCTTLDSQDHRILADLLDLGDPTNPRRPVRILEKLPPPAAQMVQEAYRRLPEGVRPTNLLLLRGAVAWSAGRHELADLEKAALERLVTHRAAHARMRALIEEDSLAIAQATYEALARPAARSSPSRPRPAATSSPNYAQAARGPAPMVSVRGSVRRR